MTILPTKLLKTVH